MLTITNEDNMAMMARYPDNHFALAIVDPPYFSGPDNLGYYGERTSSVGIKRKAYPKIGSWNLPDESYLKELKRVSKNQIIWGINYFPHFNVGPGRIIWDKCNDGTTFSDAEIASVSCQQSVRIFRFMWNGMLQGKGVLSGTTMQGNKKLNEKKIHPTQKPVALYKWLLDRFANPGDLILDTHLGSGSIAIAWHAMGYDLTACELDTVYYESAMKRIDENTRQIQLF